MTYIFLFTSCTHHKPRLQQYIQRMQPIKGTRHWLHSSQRVETHTCHPEKETKNHWKKKWVGSNACCNCRADIIEDCYDQGLAKHLTHFLLVTKTFVAQCIQGWHKTLCHGKKNRTLCGSSHRIAFPVRCSGGLAIRGPYLKGARGILDVHCQTRPDLLV